MQGVKAFEFSDFCHSGEAKPLEPTPPKPEDTACIMYTSGTTGASPVIPSASACSGAFECHNFCMHHGHMCDQISPLQWFEMVSIMLEHPRKHALGK